MQILLKTFMLMLAAIQSVISAGDPASPVAGERVDGYRGIWFTLGQPSAYGDKYSGGLGTYTANHVPMAVYAPEANKTFFTYGGAPSRERRQLVIMASYYNHARDEVPRPVVVHCDPNVDDPHDDASIQIAPDGHIWIFKSGRNFARSGFIYRSREPYSIDVFEKVDSFNMTYPQIHHDPQKGSFLLFTKYARGREPGFGSARELFWKTSTDNRTWTPDQRLAGFGGHYQVSGFCNGKIASFFNYHPEGNVDRRTNLYYVQTFDWGKTWTNIDGKPLALPLDKPQNDALVFDFEGQEKLMYTCDLNFDKNGNPILLYVTSRHYQPGPQGDPREWCVTHWTGKSWETTTLTTSTHNYDMGSLYVNGDEWRIIAPTGAGPQRWGSGGEMVLWVSPDAGKTWKAERQITSGSEFNHNYARRPLNAKNPFFAFWADGNTDSISPSRLYFTDSDGRSVWQLPYEMKGETAQPVKIR